MKTKYPKEKLLVRRVITTTKYYISEVEYDPNEDYLGDVDADLPMVKEEIDNDTTTVWYADTMELYDNYNEGVW